MYSNEEIKEKIILSEPENRDPYFAHLFCEIILEKSRLETNESEYFEALIFVSYLIHNFKSTYDDDKDKELYQKFLSSFLDFADDHEQTSNILNVSVFVSQRFKIIEKEWRKMILDDHYLSPILINNLYLNPLNESNKTMEKIMSEIEFEDLLKYNVLFRIKLKHLLSALSIFEQ
jgi:hypothetical protein